MFADTIVFLLDADAEKRGATSQTLQSAGFQVLEIENFDQALASFQASNPALIITAIRESGDVGADALDRIKNDFLLNQILVLQISPEEILTKDFFDKSPADMILAEPFNSKNLISAVRALIGFHKRQETYNQQNTMLQLSLEPIFVWDFERGIIHWNKGCERLYGFSIANALGKTSFDLLNTEFGFPREAFLETLKTTGSWNGEIYQTTKDGKRVTVESQMRVTEFGKRSLVLEVNRDVTESRRAENALRERERLLSSITETTPSLIYIYDINKGQNVYANGQINQILGYDASELRATAGDDFIVRMCHPEDAETIHARAQRIRETHNGNVFNYEYRLRNKNGEYRWLRSRETVFSRGDDQKPLLVLGVAEDITDQKLAAEKLCEAEERYRAFIAQSSEGIWRFEVDEPIDASLPVEEQLQLAYKHGYLAECNDAMARMYGFSSPQEIIGARIADLFADDEANEDYLRSFLNSGYRLTEAESHERDAEGNDVYFLNNLVGIVENNFLVRVWGTQRNVTKRKLAEDALRQSEDRYRLAVQTAALGTWDYNFLTDKLIWSETHYKLFGYDPKIDHEPTVEMFELCIHPDDLPTVLAEVEKAKREHSQFRQEYRIFRADTGELRWLTAHGQFFYDSASNEAVRFIGALIDITERKETEERIKRANERFHIAEEASNGFLYDWNAVTNHVERSAAITKVLGYTTDEINNGEADWKNLIHPEDRERAAAEFWNAIESNRNFSVEYRVRHKDGHYVDVLDRALIIRNQQGETVRVVGTTADVTERKRADAALRESEERFRLLTENLDDIFWIFNWREKRVEYVSPAFSKLLGFDGEKVFHNYKNWSKLTHPDDREVTENAFLEIEKTEKYNAEYRVLLPTGETRWLHDKGSPIRDARGEIIWVVGAAEDITDRKKIENDLRESRQHLQLSTDAAQLAPWRWDVAQNKVFLSPIHDDLWGMTEPRLMVGFEDWKARIHPDDFKKASTALANARAKRSRYEAEYRVISENDKTTTRWIRSVGQFVFNELGDPVEMYGVDYEITGRKEAENALRKSQLHMELSTEAAQIGTWQWNIRENTVYWSPLHKQMWGYEPTPDPISYEDWRIRLHPDDLQMAETEIEIALRDGSLYDIQYRIYPINDDKIRWIRSTGRVIYNELKEPVQLLGISTDVTNQKSYEAEILRLNQNLQERVEELQKLLEVLPVGVAIADSSDLDRITANRYLTDVLEIPTGKNVSASNETVNREFNWRFFRHGQEITDLELPIQRAVFTGEPLENYEFDVNMPHKEAVTFMSNAAPLFDENGKVRGAVGAYLDVTERRKTEREKEQALERERQARAEAELANRSKDEFLAVLSHELRTPLNSMFGWVRMLSAGNLDAEKTRRAVEVIERNIGLQTKLIEDILDVSRIISGKIRLETREIDLVPLILSAVEQTRPTAETKNVALETVIDSGACVLEGDAERLQQVANNLLSNAVKFTPSGGRIVVNVNCNEQAAEFSVADNGVGIEPEFLPFVFDRFRQADSTSKRKHGGLGLGLAIVKHLTELHGGEVAVSSEGANQGATFYVRLPMKCHSPSNDATEAFNVLNNHHEHDFDGSTIMLVDDDPDALEMLRVMLSAQGAQIVVANSAIEALSVLKTQRPDVLVSDIGMPEMSGVEFVVKLRKSQNQWKRKLPAIALTAYASAEDRTRILAAGFDKYQTKPIVFAELLENLKELLKKRSDVKNGEKQ